MVEGSYSLGSKQIKELIEQEILVGNPQDKKIQTSSFEPSVQDEFFFLKTKGAFSPHHESKIRRQILELPSGHRSRVELSENPFINQGFSYFMPLQEQIRMQSDLWVISTPKSTSGRTFNRVRLMADYQVAKDEIVPTTDELLNLWLLVEPQAFDQRVPFDHSFNQLRFFRKTKDENHIRDIRDELRDSRDLTHLAPELYLTSEDKAMVSLLFNPKKSFTAEVRGEDLATILEKRPLLYDKHTKQPLTTSFHDGVQVHLDLEGRTSNGVVGFELLQDPRVLDLSVKEHYDLLEFHEPILASEDPLHLKAGHKYLFTIKEIINLPHYLNAQLRATSLKGIRADLHEAGFIDNRFIGDVVLEITPYEDMLVQDGMAISALDFFRTPLPDRVYGTEHSGSHYFEQTGSRPAKIFTMPDYPYIAKEFKRLERRVITQDADIMKELMPQEGFEFINTHDPEKIEKIITSGIIHDRYNCEFDKELVQIVPYAVIFGPDNTVLTYTRPNSPHDVGDMRLADKQSIGFGGHLLESDSPDYFFTNISNRISLELSLEEDITRPLLVGKLYTTREDIDQYHFGFIHAMRTQKGVASKDPSVLDPHFQSIDELMQNYQNQNFESWSQILIPQLKGIQAVFNQNY